MKRIIIAVGASMLVFLPSLAIADTPKHTIRDSQILPYLLDNPSENPTVRVRCWPKHQQDSERADIRNHLLQSNSDNPTADTVTIDIAGSCRNVKIRLQNDASFDNYPVYNPYLEEHHPNLDDSWLTRQGSGWYWLLRHP